jgi:phage recombination protein Bet
MSIGAAGAPRPVLEAFLLAVRRTGLDPIAKQIYCIQLSGKWTVVVGIDGFRLTAQRSGEYAGQEHPQWTDGKLVDRPMLVNGEVVRHADGTIVMNQDYNWYDVWTPELGEHPFAARVMVHRKGFDHPTVGIATWDAYAKPYTGDKDYKNQWDINGPNQLAKCAEALALRKAYPMELSGLYTSEEIGEVESRVVDATEDGEDEWERDARQCGSVNQINALYGLMKEKEQWTPRRDAVFRARKAELVEAEERAGNEDVEDAA